jgi:galactose mutarotase-like enzyme
MRLAYRLTNLGRSPLVFLWAAHPQFACEEGARIVLPQGTKEVVNVLPLDWGREWGEPGTRNPWPAKTGPDGRPLRQDIVASPERRGGRKFYLPPEAPIYEAGLQRPAKGCALRMVWDLRELPYCGVWIDEGALNQAPSVAIEPTSGYYDSLALAWENGRAAELGPGETRTWELELHLDGER